MMMESRKPKYDPPWTTTADPGRSVAIRSWINGSLVFGFPATVLSKVVSSMNKKKRISTNPIAPTVHHSWTGQGDVAEM
jgi:hypothetical protein